MTRPLQNFSKSDYLIQIVDINSNIGHKQYRSRSDGFFRNHLIWIYTVCKGRAYLGSAGPGLNMPTGFKMDLFKFKDNYCKKLKCPNILTCLNYYGRYDMYRWTVNNLQMGSRLSLCAYLINNLLICLMLLTFFEDQVNSYEVEQLK